VIIQTLLRIFIPRWGFFNDIGSGAKILVSCSQTESECTQWEDVFVFQNKSWTHLFVNPNGNYNLLSISCFERLLSESQEFINNPKGLTETVTYKICSAIVSQKILSRNFVLQPKYYKFKIQCFINNKATVEDAFVSQVHKID